MDNSILFRASGLGYIMSGHIGITESQLSEMKKLLAKKEAFDNTEEKAKDLTDLQKVKLEKLIHINDNPSIPDGIKTHLVDKWVFDTFQVRNNVSTVYTEKGNEVEQDSIDLLSELHLFIYQQNIKHFANDYVKGTPDLLPLDVVRDIKSSWDLNTFFRTKYKFVMKNQLDPLYYWQLQAYMWLTERDVSYLNYCLIDTPNFIVDRYIKQQMYKNYGIISEEEEKNIRNQHKFDYIPKEKRMFEIRVDRNNSDIEEIKKRVEISRGFMQKLNVELS